MPLPLNPKQLKAVRAQLTQAAVTSRLFEAHNAKMTAAAAAATTNRTWQSSLSSRRAGFFGSASPMRPAANTGFVMDIDKNPFDSNTPAIMIGTKIYLHDEPVTEAVNEALMEHLEEMYERRKTEKAFTLSDHGEFPGFALKITITYKRKAEKPSDTFAGEDVDIEILALEPGGTEKEVQMIELSAYSPTQYWRMKALG